MPCSIVTFISSVIKNGCRGVRGRCHSGFDAGEFFFNQCLHFVHAQQLLQNYRVSNILIEIKSHDDRCSSCLLCTTTTIVSFSAGKSSSIKCRKWGTPPDLVIYFVCINNGASITATAA